MNQRSRRKLIAISLIGVCSFGASYAAENPKARWYAECIKGKDGMITCQQGDVSRPKVPTPFQIQAQASVSKTAKGATEQEGDPSVNAPPVIVQPKAPKNSIVDAAEKLAREGNPIQGDPSKGVPPVIRNVLPSAGRALGIR
ncbi:hypothetical protein [Bradyrhizobium sp. UNPF46]|uniref:hypothetical protein n=1 Tax=Bradyrhizobium sp. UNPF46 TaxID=1141168 RepID=UPI00114E179D|nr:hypothetical protein [Bradyrhizobium sp. UNPF46]